jgi:hypothetical protein
MKIFISWSGDVSRYVAEALARWLLDVNHSLSPWVSSRDIQAGAPWWIKLAQQLRDTNFGVICVTRSNLTAPWLLFEAGALAKQVEGLANSMSSGDDYSVVCPYLIGGLRSADVPQGPLSQFQHAEATEAGTLFLLKSINSVLAKAEPGNGYDDAWLRRAFERWWPDLRDQLTALPSKELVTGPVRPQQEIIEETLALVRELVRRTVAADRDDREMGAAQELINARRRNRELEREGLIELRDFIRTQRTALADFMEQGASLRVDGDLLTVTPRYDIYVRYLTDNRNEIAEFASKFYGRRVRVEMSPIVAKS